MKTSLSSLDVKRPETLGEALEMLADAPALMPIAGCTDVYVGLNFDTLKAHSFIDIWGLDDLRGIDSSGDTLRFGALCTHTDMISSVIVQERLPMLVAACREIGGVQIQNRGTLGGNIANGSPAGDTLPVFAAADARIVISHRAGERSVPFPEFDTGYRATVLQPGELVTAIVVPRVEGRQWFRKVGTRAAQAISKIVIAAVRGTAPRLAIGSVGPTVLRLHRTESLMAAGAGASEEEIVKTMLAEIAPIDDIRSTASYRNAVAANLLRRFLVETA